MKTEGYTWGIGKGVYATFDMNPKFLEGKTIT